MLKVTVRFRILLLRRLDIQVETHTHHAKFRLFILVIPTQPYHLTQPNHLLILTTSMNSKWSLQSYLLFEPYEVPFSSVHYPLPEVDGNQKTHARILLAWKVDPIWMVGFIRSSFRVNPPSILERLMGTSHVPKDQWLCMKIFVFF